MSLGFNVNLTVVDFPGRNNPVLAKAFSSSVRQDPVFQGIKLPVIFGVPETDRQTHF